MLVVGVVAAQLGTSRSGENITSFMSKFLFKIYFQLCVHGKNLSFLGDFYYN